MKNKRKVLFITVAFYDYADKIRSAIATELGADVDVLTLNSPVSFFGAGVNYLTKGKYQIWKEKKRQKRWYSNHINEKYDIIFTIVGRNLDLREFSSFVSKQGKQERILYLWDDVARIDNIDEKRKLFSRIVSFDMSDCIQYGFEFVPLFFVEDYRYGGEKKELDIVFVGSSHTNRTKTVEKLLSLYPKNQYRWYIRFVVSKARLVSERIIHRKDKMLQYFSERNISGKESAFLLKSSKCVIDIPHAGQRGLSMRMTEALAAHTKVITTNSEVKRYNFFDDRNICIYDGNTSSIPSDFVTSDYCKIEDDIVNLYSLNHWIKTVFQLIENPYYDSYV